MQRPEHLSYAFLGSFLVSIFCLQWWQSVHYPNMLFLVIGIAVCHALLLPRIRILLLSGLLGVCLALFTVVRTTHIPSSHSIDTFAEGDYVTLRGSISEYPDRRALQTKYTIEVDELTSGKNIYDHLSGRVLVSDQSGGPEHRYGDRVSVTGKLEKPEAIDDFSYDAYLSRYDIYALMNRVRIQSLQENTGNPIFRGLFSVKDRFEGNINRLFPEPHASLLAGLLTGSRRGIPDHLKQSFQDTGITHIIAISGYNITIVILVISAFFLWLPLSWRLIPTSIAIILFMLFVGASAAVVRASIMGILNLLALHVGRTTQIRLTVLWTLGLMLVWNPKYLWYDAGFQLSFLAVLGLLEVSPLLEKFLKKIPQTLGIREALQMTCAAQIAALPLLIIQFHQFSVIAPLTNILVTPVIPLAMLFGFIGTLISTIVFPLGQIFAFFAWILLSWIIGVATVLAEIPFGSMEIPRAPILVAALYYLLLCTMIAARSFTIRTKGFSLSLPSQECTRSV